MRNLIHSIQLCILILVIPSGRGEVVEFSGTVRSLTRSRLDVHPNTFYRWVITVWEIKSNEKHFEYKQILICSEGISRYFPDSLKELTGRKYRFTVNEIRYNNQVGEYVGNLIRAEAP